jgi:hypothetical protein
MQKELRFLYQFSHPLAQKNVEFVDKLYAVVASAQHPPAPDTITETEEKHLYL